MLLLCLWCLNEGNCELNFMEIVVLIVIQELDVFAAFIDVKNFIVPFSRPCKEDSYKCIGRFP